MHGLLQLALDFFSHAPAGRVVVEENPLNSDKNAVPPSVDIDHSALKNGADVLLSNHPLANRQARLGAVVVAFHLQRARRRSIGFLIGLDGLTVRAPARTTLREIDAAVQEKADWIVRKLGEMRLRETALARARIDWRSGVVVDWLGQPLQVLVDSQCRHGAVRIEGPDGTARLHVAQQAGDSPAALREATEAWLRQQARTLFEARLNHYAPLLGVQWRRLGLSNANTRWGSASASGNIRLNWRLIHLRQPVIDYVVVHELAHLRVMDHSPRFWATVGAVMPDYAALRAELKSAAVPKWD